MIGDINGTVLAATAKELAHADNLATVETDVTRRADIERLVAAAVEKFGRLDIMLNNAGIAAAAPLGDHLARRRLHAEEGAFRLTPSTSSKS